MTPPRFEKVAIIGTGLLGASLGLALKAQGMAGYVRGVGRRRETLDTALALGAIDEAFLNPADAVADADLVAICVAAAQVPDMMDLVRLECPARSLVTDVASTKAAICRHAALTWPRPRRFVGSHPMAGSEKSGPEHASANLYAGHTVILEPGQGLEPGAFEMLRAMWRALGTTVIEMEPELHDSLVARTSHLPHVVASCLAAVAARAEAAPDMLKAVVGQGFRDTTRIAGSRPDIWRDICLTNRAAILEALAEMIGDLQAVRMALAEEDGTRVEAFFEKGRAARGRMVGS